VTRLDRTVPADAAASRRAAESIGVHGMLSAILFFLSVSLCLCGKPYVDKIPA